MAQPSSSRGNANDVVLLARGPAWGLPTGCPSCLSAYIYLKLAQVDFSICYNDVAPDADYLPAVEYGESVAYSNDLGGISGFLETQGIANLDAGFSDSDIAFVRSFIAMIWSHLHSMLLCELWDLDNSRVAQHIYFSSLPWPLNKILYWKQQLNNWNYLGLKKGNIEQVNEKMERKATEAYASLSTFLGDKKFFLSARPSSLDAVFLSHALFIMKAPLENSHLKEELNRHSNLVSYVENLQREFLDAQGSAPLAKSVYKRPKRVPAPLRHRPPVQRTEKVKNAKWRSKWFLAAQAASVILALYAWGISAIEIVEEEDEDSFDAD